MEEGGFILIADITGYTAYLNRSELDHAQGTLTDLLELLIDHTRPPLAISRLEGDAVFSYALDGAFVSGQTFVESIEDTYIAFRRAIELMVLNNTCRCNACANVSAPLRKPHLYQVQHRVVCLVSAECRVSSARPVTHARQAASPCSCRCCREG